MTIKVHKTATQDMVGAGVRQAILVIGGIVAGSGAANDDTIATIAGVGGTLAAFLYGQWKTRRRAKQLATVTELVPDEVAKLY